MQEIIVVPINEVKEEVYANFDCGEKILNKHLKISALIDHKNKHQTTYLCFTEKLGLVGYYSIETHLLQYNQNGGYQGLYKDGVSKEYTSSLNLEFLATKKIYQGKGFGTKILTDIINKMREISNEIGIRFFTTHPINNKKKDWYIKKGFVDLDDDYNLCIFDLMEEGVENEGN